MLITRLQQAFHPLPIFFFAGADIGEQYVTVLIFLLYNIDGYAISFYQLTFSLIVWNSVQLTSQDNAFGFRTNTDQNFVITNMHDRALTDFTGLGNFQLNVRLF